MARKSIAKAINCSPKNVCFIGGATEGLTMIVHGLAHYFKKAEVLLNNFEHASFYYHDITKDKMVFLQKNLII